MTEILERWLLENYPIILKLWEDEFSDYSDYFDLWLKKYYGWVDEEFQLYLEGEK